MKKDEIVSVAKEPKKKKFWLRKTVKEIKRVRWPDAKTNTKNFVRIILFTTIFSLFVYGVSIAFTSILDKI